MPIIVWVGEYKSVLYARYLGPSGVPSRSIVPIKYAISNTMQLRHNEGITHRHGTSTTIGTGEAKMYRKCAIVGYAVGCTPNNLDKPPDRLDMAKCCLLAYDIEVEFAGAGNQCTHTLCWNQMHLWLFYGSE
jgi:hypothetical protein